MRESLLQNFDVVWVDNLHGNRIASEHTPWGQSCETIFNTADIGPGIKVGTCVSTFLKRPKHGQANCLRDFWGRAEDKRQALVSSVDLDSWTAVKRKVAAERPEGPRKYRAFSPRRRQVGDLRLPRESGFEDWPAL